MKKVDVRMEIKAAVASIHGFLLQAALVSSVPAELQILLHMILLDEAGAPEANVEVYSQLRNGKDKLVTCESPVSFLPFGAISMDVLRLQIQQYGPAKSIAEEDLFREASGPRRFANSTDAAMYACHVLQKCSRLVYSLGDQAVAALVAEPAVAMHTPEFHAALKQWVSGQHQLSAAAHFGRFKSPPGQHQGFTRSKLGQNPPLLPFQAASDSRHNFKSREEQQLYNNREQCRDAFYAVMRDAAAVLPPGGSTMLHLDRATSQLASANPSRDVGALRGHVRASMESLLPANYLWFAGLFVEQITQVASTGEADPEVTNLAGGNSGRLQRLHQRLTSAAHPPPIPADRDPVVPTLVKASSADSLAAWPPPSPRPQPPPQPRSPAVASTAPSAWAGTRGGFLSGRSPTGGGAPAGGAPAGFGKENWGASPSERAGGAGAPRAVLADVGPPPQPNRQQQQLAPPSDRGGLGGPKGAATKGQSWSHSQGQAWLGQASWGQAPGQSQGQSQRVGEPAAALRSGGDGGNGGGGGGSSGGAGAALCPLLPRKDLLALFPEGVRAYVAFLELADSHQLGLCVRSTLLARIAAFTQHGHCSGDGAWIGSSSGERALVLKTLALFLGYLSFSFQAAPQAHPQPPPGGDASHQPQQGGGCAGVGQGPVDVEGVSQQASRDGSLLLNLPWLLDYVRLLQLDAGALRLGTYDAAVGALAKLYCLPMLQPASAAFGVASMCIVSLLDGFFETAGEHHKALAADCKLVAAEGASEAASSGETHLALPGVKGRGAPLTGLLGGSSHAAPAAPSVVKPQESAPVSAVAADVADDDRYIQNCCPSFARIRKLLTGASQQRKARHGAASSGGAEAEQAWPQLSAPAVRIKPSRKITPLASLPADNSPGASLSAELASPGLPEEPSLKLQLQAAFFEQHPFLRRLVEFTTEAVAFNCAKAAAAKAVPPAVAAAVRQADETRAEPACRPPEGETTGRRVEATVEAETEELISRTTDAALQGARVFAALYAKEQARAALAALGPSDTPPHALNTAAGIAAEAAYVAASQRLLLTVAPAVRSAILARAAEAGRKIPPQKLIAAADQDRPGAPGTPEQEASGGRVLASHAEASRGIHSPVKGGRNFQGDNCNRNGAVDGGLGERGGGGGVGGDAAAGATEAPRWEEPSGAAGSRPEEGRQGSQGTDRCRSAGCQSPVSGAGEAEEACRRCRPDDARGRASSAAAPLPSPRQVAAAQALEVAQGSQRCGGGNDLSCNRVNINSGAGGAAGRGLESDGGSSSNSSSQPVSGCQTLPIAPRASTSKEPEAALAGEGAGVEKGTGQAAPPQERAPQTFPTTTAVTQAHQAPLPSCPPRVTKRGAVVTKEGAEGESLPAPHSAPVATLQLPSWPPPAASTTRAVTRAASYPLPLLVSLERACTAVASSCNAAASDPDVRLHTRHQLAAICVALEGMLGCIKGGIPPGGIDSLLCKQASEAPSSALALNLLGQGAGSPSGTEAPLLKCACGGVYPHPSDNKEFRDGEARSECVGHSARSRCSRSKEPPEAEALSECVAGSVRLCGPGSEGPGDKEPTGLAAGCGESEYFVESFLAKRVRALAQQLASLDLCVLLSSASRLAALACPGRHSRPSCGSPLEESPEGATGGAEGGAEGGGLCPCTCLEDAAFALGWRDGYATFVPIRALDKIWVKFRGQSDAACGSEYLGRPEGPCR